MLICVFYERMAGHRRKIPQYSRHFKGREKVLQILLRGRSTVELDKQGRILLPPVLREYAGLEKDVVLVGVLNRVEIWNKGQMAGEYI